MESEIVSSRPIAELKDVSVVSESIQSGDSVLMVRVYPWGLEFELVATEKLRFRVHERTPCARASNGGGMLS